MDGPFIPTASAIKSMDVWSYPFCENKSSAAKSILSLIHERLQRHLSTNRKRIERIFSFTYIAISSFLLDTCFITVCFFWVSTLFCLSSIRSFIDFGLTNSLNSSTNPFTLRNLSYCCILFFHVFN